MRRGRWDPSDTIWSTFFDSLSCCNFHISMSLIDKRGTFGVPCSAFCSTLTECMCMWAGPLSFRKRSSSKNWLLNDTWRRNKKNTRSFSSWTPHTRKACWTQSDRYDLLTTLTGIYLMLVNDKPYIHQDKREIAFVTCIYIYTSRGTENCNNCIHSGHFKDMV